MKPFRLLLFVLLLPAGSFAQDTIAVKKDTVNVYQVSGEKEAADAPRESKIYYGGYLGLMFGSYTAISIEPLIAYKITPRISAGAILTYEYIGDNTNQASHYTASNYGASVFSRFRVIPQIYLHAEFSEMNYKTSGSSGYIVRHMVPFLFLGGGFSQQISQNTWMNAQLLFDVLQNENSPYARGTPFYSVGFGVGF